MLGNEDSDQINVNMAQISKEDSIVRVKVPTGIRYESIERVLGGERVKAWKGTLGKLIENSHEG